MLALSGEEKYPGGLFKLKLKMKKKTVQQGIAYIVPKLDVLQQYIIH